MERTSFTTCLWQQCPFISDVPSRAPQRALLQRLLPEAALQRRIPGTSWNQPLTLEPLSDVLQNQFWTPPEQHFIEVAFQILGFLVGVKAAEEMGEFLKELRYPCVTTPPAWEFLKVRDLKFSILKAKPTKDGCLLDCPHTPTAGLEKIFL